jgi:hypothetical protein
LPSNLLESKWNGHQLGGQLQTSNRHRSWCRCSNLVYLPNSILVIFYLLHNIGRWRLIMFNLRFYHGLEDFQTSLEIQISKQYGRTLNYIESISLWQVDPIKRFDSHGLGTGVSREGNSIRHMRYHLASSRESYKSSLGILFLMNSTLYLIIQFFISSSSSFSSRQIRKLFKASSSSSVLSQSMTSGIGGGASTTQVL